MDEIIRVRNSSYDRYEELLLRRDRLRKEAFISQRAYTARFGDLIIKVFEKKIECIRKKKTIEFCQAEANYGRSVDTRDLQAYLEKEMAEFEAHLKEMTEDVKSARNRGCVSELDLLEIKKIYRKLVKLIHPDINPLVEQSEELQELWRRVVIAYNCNDLQELEALEVLVVTALEHLGIDGMTIEITDIEDKIDELQAEIERIMTTDPYMYKYLLDDPEAVRAKEESLEEEFRAYEEYSAQLEKILEELMGKGVSFVWRMN